MASDPLELGVGLREQLRSKPEVWDHMPAVVADLPQLPIRLMGADPKLFGTYDRLRAEADFRFAVFVPLSLLSVAPAFVQGMWLVLLVFAAGPFASGQERSLWLDTLAEALRAGRVGLPTLERITAQKSTR